MDPEMDIEDQHSAMMTASSVTSSLSYAQIAKANSVSNVNRNFGNNLRSSFASRNLQAPRFHRATAGDLMKLDLAPNTLESEANVSAEPWTDESHKKITEAFNQTIPKDLFSTFKRFFKQHSVIIAITDRNCSLYRFPRELLIEAINNTNLWNSIVCMGGHPNPRYFVIEFDSDQSKTTFTEEIKMLGQYALVIINPNRENFITGLIKNTYLDYSILDFTKLMQPFGEVIDFQQTYIRNTPIPIRSNNYKFKVKLRENINPESIPTQISDQEATLFLVINGLRPQCFYCKERGHLISNCPVLYCSNCNMKTSSMHQCPKEKIQSKQDIVIDENSSTTLNHDQAKNNTNNNNSVNSSQQIISSNKSVSSPSNTSVSLRSLNKSCLEIMDSLAVCSSELPVVHSNVSPASFSNESGPVCPENRKKPGRPLKNKNLINNAKKIKTGESETSDNDSPPPSSRKKANKIRNEKNTEIVTHTSEDISIEEMDDSVVKINNEATNTFFTNRKTRSNDAINISPPNS